MQQCPGTSTQKMKLNAQHTLTVCQHLSPPTACKLCCRQNTLSEESLSGKATLALAASQPPGKRAAAAYIIQVLLPVNSSSSGNGPALLSVSTPFQALNTTTPRMVPITGGRSQPQIGIIRCYAATPQPASTSPSALLQQHRFEEQTTPDYTALCSDSERPCRSSTAGTRNQPLQAAKGAASAGQTNTTQCQEQDSMASNPHTMQVWCSLLLRPGIKTQRKIHLPVATGRVFAAIGIGTTQQPRSNLVSPLPPHPRAPHKPAR